MFVFLVYVVIVRVVFFLIEINKLNSELKVLEKANKNYKKKNINDDKYLIKIIIMNKIIMENLFSMNVFSMKLQR